jgi:hypothetical protein
MLKTVQYSEQQTRLKVIASQVMKWGFYKSRQSRACQTFLPNCELTELTKIQFIRQSQHYKKQKAQLSYPKNMRFSPQVFNNIGKKKLGRWTIDRTATKRDTRHFGVMFGADPHIFSILWGQGEMQHT